MIRLIATLAVIQSVLGADLRTARSGECYLPLSDLNSPQPVLLKGETFLQPSMPNGIILNRGESIRLACVGEGRHLRHLATSFPNITIATATCVSNNLVSVDDLEVPRTQFVNLHCNDHPEVKVELTEEKCYNDHNIINVGYDINDVFHLLYKACYNLDTLELFNVWFDQTPANFISQLVIPEPGFTDNYLQPGTESVNIAELYVLNSQRRRIAELIGVEQTNVYITQENHLVPHRLAASHNFVFEFGQRTTFFYINTAPYWKINPMNQIGDIIQRRFIHLDYALYSGTHDILKLRDSDNQLVDIYLGDNSTLPVPLYAYFVAYQQSTKLGTAFICVNNPYMVETEKEESVFCKDECLNNNKFDWLPFEDSENSSTRCFCCSVDNFRSTVKSLPDFEVIGMLTGSSVTIIVSRWLLGLLTYIVFKFT